jgi:YHS domain-containing protein
MTRNLTLFLATFIASALIALVVRAAMFQAHDGHDGHPPAGGDYAQMVSNPLAPAAPEATAADPHAGHGAPAAPSADSGKPVNTVCAICGMPVNPKLPTAQYQGKTIGFGCKMCPPKFKADPDRYGPAYLRNEVLK